MCKDIVEEIKAILAYIYKLMDDEVVLSQSGRERLKEHIRELEMNLNDLCNYCKYYD